jgi:hypothetical protein
MKYNTHNHYYSIISINNVKPEMEYCKIGQVEPTPDNPENPNVDEDKLE